MQPHRMARGSPLFVWDDAARVGVGEALHQLPPAWAERRNSRASSPGGIAVRREHMQLMNKYDVNMCNWSWVCPFLSDIPIDRCPMNITEGKQFPWWVWMANTGQLSRISGNGVIEIFLIIADGQKHLIIAREDGYTKVTKKGQFEPLEEEEYLLYRNERVVHNPSTSAGHSNTRTNTRRKKATWIVVPEPGAASSSS